MKKKLKSLCTVAWRGLFSGLFLRIGRIVGLLMMGGERVSIARVLLELKLQDEEEQGMEWEPDVMDAYHWLCWLEGIRGYDLLSLSHLEEVERSHLERGLPVRSWIHTRIQRGRCPYLRDTSRDRPSPRARSLWGCLYSFFLENDERMHHYQRGRVSITGLMVELREIIETGRLVVVVMTRLVRHFFIVGITRRL
jgi:hypothetical protein